MASAQMAIDFTIPEEEIQISRTLLGEGACSRVYSATWHGAAVAIKFIRNSLPGEYPREVDRDETHLLECFRKEFYTMCCLRHPNIVRLFGVYAPATRHVGLVMELMDTSLQNRTEAGPTLLPPCLIHILRDLTSGLVYLHSQRFIHRDISPRSVLLSGDTTQQRVVAKLSDFATTKAVDTIGFDRYSSVLGHLGTLAYLPCEAINKDPETQKLTYSSSVDIYSVGAVGLFAALGKVPGGTPQAKPRYLKNLGPKHVLYDVLKECLDSDPRLRPTSILLQGMLEKLQESSACQGSCCHSADASLQETKKLVEHLQKRVAEAEEKLQRFTDEGRLSRQQLEKEHKALQQATANEKQVRSQLADLQQRYDQQLARFQEQEKAPLQKRENRWTRSRKRVYDPDQDRDAIAPLQKSENRWTRSRERVYDPDQDRDATIAMQKVRGILNKLTPQNCDKLIGQMKELPINNEKRLQGCIDLCFEKAVLEPMFSALYAKFCHVFMQMKVPISADAKETVSFRKLLLTKCQREFEKYKTEEQWRKELQTAVGEAKTEEEATAKKDEIELQVMLAKKRSLGNICFIGELFKLKMLTESIMHECLVKLLRAPDKESLECLSRLLTTVGKLLDHDKAKPRMVQYFQQIKRIIDLNRVSLRIKFMLQDLVELRQNGWVPRHADNNPKTLDQIHREIQEEQQQMKMEQKQAELMRKDKRGVQPGRGSSGRVNEDGWQMAGSRGMRKSSDPTQLKGVSARLADGAKRDADLQLGPGGKSFASWGRSSSGGASGGAHGAHGAQSAAVTTGSRYASLSGAPEGPRSLDRQPPPNRGGSGGALPRQNSRGNVPSSPMRRSTSISTPGTPTRHTAKPGRDEALQLARQLSSGGLTRSSTEEKYYLDAQTLQPAADLLSQAEVEKKTEALIKEYLSVRDLKEAKQCVLELQSPGQHHNVVLTILNSCIDRKADDCTQAGQLLLSLTQEQVLSSEQCHAGIQGLLEFAVDMEIDIPHVWKHLAALVGPLVAEGFCQLDRLVSVKSLQSSKKGGVFAAAILSNVVQRKRERVACEQWLDSRLAWNSFLPEGRDVEEFVKEKGVAFTYKPTLPFLVAQKASSDKLIDFIERIYSEEERAQPAFLRMLVREIIQSCIQSKCIVAFTL